MNTEQAKAVNAAVDLNEQVRDWEKAIAANPTGYFEEQMQADLPALREKARLANNAAHQALEGMRYNDVSENWEPVR